MNNDINTLLKKINIFKEKYQEYKNQNKIDEIELYECICDILSWVEICIKNVNIEDEVQNEKISAIKYANNMKKHSVSIFQYNLNTYALYPSDTLYPSNNLYPSDFKIYWNKLPLDNAKFKNQYRNYLKYLDGKGILETIEEIYIIIENNKK